MARPAEKYDLSIVIGPEAKNCPPAVKTPGAEYCVRVTPPELSWFRKPAAEGTSLNRKSA